MINTEKMVYDGFHKVIQMETVMKERKVKREKLLVKSAVAGIVIDEEDKIAIVTQYRPVIGKTMKEIPAGLLDKEGLTPVEILIEELMEECEIPKEDILTLSSEPIHKYFMIAGSADSTISIYLVRVKKQENKVVKDSDVDSVEWISLETMERYIKDGLISDGKTILAYYLAKEKGNL